MKFKTAYNLPESVDNTPLGDPLVPTFGYRIDKKTGKRILERTGETNIYEKIQANLESTKVENIVKKFTSGDINALNQRQGLYLDLTEVPTNLLELQNTILRAREEFDTLPAEIRKKFENSAEKFISMYGSEEFMEIMGYTKNTPDLSKEITNDIAAAEKEESGNE